jgi:hypothetical protein
MAKDKNEHEHFVLKDKILQKSFDFDKERHLMKMKELEFQRESDRLHHEREMERGRIKSAEIRKAQMRKFDNDPFHH